MGKKSRRARQRGAQAANDANLAHLAKGCPRGRLAPIARRVKERFRPATDYGVSPDDAAILYQVQIEMLVQSEHDVCEDEYKADVDSICEYIPLRVFQVYRQNGLEDALREMRRWPRLRPYWSRLRRRVCDYCGKQRDLSEPRLLVCSGCAVARYCDEECQAADFTHHEKCCPVLARRWDGVGSCPSGLKQAVLDGTWKNPKIIPSAQAREALGGIRSEVRRIGHALHSANSGDSKVL